MQSPHAVITILTNILILLPDGEGQCSSHPFGTGVSLERTRNNSIGKLHCCVRCSQRQLETEARAPRGGATCCRAAARLTARYDRHAQTGRVRAHARGTAPGRRASTTATVFVNSVFIDSDAIY